MSNSTKLIIGFVLGYVGYMAYRKILATKTVVIDTTETLNPKPVDILSSDVSMMAGRR